MTPTTVVIHLDGAAPSLVERWSDAGHLPALGRLARRGAAMPLVSRGRLLPGSSWAELATGQPAFTTGIFHERGQIRTGEIGLRRLTPDDVPDTHWAIADRGGRRVAVIDPMVAGVDSRFDGVLLTGWTAHDVPLERVAQPGSFGRGVRARWGEPSLGRRGDLHECVCCSRAELPAALGQDAARKADLVVDLLGQAHWDLLVCDFSELHCAGHMLWGEAAGDRSQCGGAPRADPLLAVYRHVDAALGRIIDAAGPGATVIVVSTGGMRGAFGGVVLLSEIPGRLGMGPRRGLRMRAHRALPRSLYWWGLRAVAPAVRNRLGLGPCSFSDPRADGRTRVFPVQNGTAGAFRLNLVGREARGIVQPGDEAEQVLDELTGELLALRVEGTDEPLCERVVRVAEAFGPDAHPDLPDLIVLTRTDLGPIRACTSRRLGHLRERDGSPATGHHSGESQVWIAAPGAPAIGRGRKADLVDIAPTVLASLGLDVPPSMPGRPLAAPPAVSSHVT